RFLGAAPLAPLYLAVFLSAIRRGPAQGWVAFGLSAVVVLLRLTPLVDLTRRPHPLEFAAVAAAVCVGIIVLAGRTHDAVERSRAREAELARLNRLYDALSQVDQAIVWSGTRQELFDKVCQALVERGGFRMCWIGQADRESSRMSVLARHGDEHDYLGAVEIYVDQRPEGRGPSGTAFHEGRPYVANDFRSDPATLPWRQAAARSGFRAVAAFPIRQQGMAWGVLAVYADVAGFFRDREVALLEEAATDLSYALDNFVRDAEHSAAEAAAMRERQLTDSVVESTPGILYLYDEQGRFLRWNRNFLTVSGYTAEEMAGLRPQDFFRGDDVARVSARIAEVFARGESALEAGFVTKDGRVIPYYFTGRRAELDGRPCLVGMGIDISERVRAEDATRRSEERYHSTLDSIAEGAQILGPDWRYLYLNPAAERHNRRPNSELLGRTMPEAWPGIEGTPVFALLRRCQEERVAAQGEIAFTFSDGEVRWFDVRAHPVPEGIFVLSVDVTAEHEARSALSRHAALQRIVGRVARIGGWQIELPGRTMSWSDEVCDMHEVPRGCRLSLEEGLAMFAPESREPMAQALEACIAAGTPYDLELVKLTARGRRFWVRTIGEAVRDADGRIIRVQGAIQDINERKEAETRLAEQAALLDHARDAIIVRDLEHRVRYWNRSAERMYGWSAAEAAGRPVTELFYRPPGTPEEFLRAMALLLEVGEWTGDLEQRTRDGNVVVVEGRWSLLRDPAGTPTSVLAINTDVSHRKALERQLLRAQRLESIGTLAGGIAHDLNNVLTPIMMSIELLRADDTAEGRLETIDTIASSARKGAEMVRQVLSFARGVEGQRVPVDIPTLVKEVEKLVNDTFLKSIEVSARVAPDLPLVLGDPTQLHQVLLNLCVNARDAMPEGGTLLIVADRHQVDARYVAINPDARVGTYVTIEVSDSGEGMKPEVLDRIFDPFFTTKEQGKGTGLGLSTSLAIVKGHGGFFRVRSTPGSGSQFMILLPAHSGEPVATAALVEAAPATGNGELVLVVDDEAAIRDVTRRILEGNGYRVVLAGDGAAGLATYRRRRDEVAVVLTDMMMPLMDGDAVIAALRKIDPRVPIIAVSGVVEGVAAGEVLAAAGRTRHLPKPYTTTELLRAVHGVLHPPDASTPPA
ncbi:MAG TPA: PAS domain S-box protein, partial [Gemmatimonadales bacterium]|nr:PAS domain S-box protein [Gemmatimonadales bacterium]